MLRIGFRVRGSIASSTVMTSAQAGHWIVWPTSRFDTRISALHSQSATWASDSTAGGASLSGEPADVSKIAVSVGSAVAGSSTGGSSSNETTPSSFFGWGGSAGTGSAKTGRITVRRVPGITFFSRRILRPQVGQDGSLMDIVLWTSTAAPQPQFQVGPGGAGAGSPGFAGAAPGGGS